MRGLNARHLALVAGVAAIVLLTNLGGPRLWDRDEPRNAGCAREMLERGDWIVPIFNAELRTHKPVLLYWLIMSAYSLLGVNEFTARLPSALCGIGACLATYAMGRRMFPRSAALWSGVALATSVMFVVAGRAATPDAVLIFCVTAAMAVYVCGTFQPNDESQQDSTEPAIPGLRLKREGQWFPQDLRWVIALYAVMGLAVLAKGPVGLVLPTAVIGMFLLVMRLQAPLETSLPTWRSRAVAVLRPFAPLHFLRTCWYMRPLWAVGIAALVALPWYIAVGVQSDGEFLRGFLLEHNLERAAKPMEGHDGGPLFYPAAVLIGFFPWSIFAIPVAWDALARLRRRDPESPAIAFCLCWIGVYLGLFSLAQTKLPSYVTPCYPALALLTGSFIDRWRLGVALGPTWMPRLGFGILAVVGVALAIGLPLVARKELPGEEWLGVIGLVPLVAGALAIVAERFGRRTASLWTMGAGSVALATLLFALAPQRADLHQKNHVMLQAIFSQSANPQLAAYRALEPSWVFYGGRAIQEFPRLPSAVAGGSAALANKPALTPAAVAQLGREQAAAFLAGDPDAFLITTGRRYAELQPHLPSGVEVVSETPLFLKDDRLIVLRGQPTLQAARQPTHGGEYPQRLPR